MAVAAGDDLPVTISADGLQEVEDSPTISLEAGQAYEVIAWTLAEAPVSIAETVIEIDAFRVDLTPLPADQGRFRLINLAADAGNLDAVTQPTPADSRLIDDVGESNASRYEVMDAGSYEIEIRHSGESGSVFETRHRHGIRSCL